MNKSQVNNGSLPVANHDYANESATVVTCGRKSTSVGLKLADWSFLFALVSVIHPDWLVRLNFLLRVSDNLHTESHQNSWISTSKNVGC